MIEKAVTIIDLRQRREKLGMTRRELAQITGISQTLIYRIEKGERVPSLAVLCELVNMIGPLRVQCGSSIYRFVKIGDSLEVDYE